MQTKTIPESMSHASDDYFWFGILSANACHYCRSLFMCKYVHVSPFLKIAQYLALRSKRKQWL